MRKGHFFILIELEDQAASLNLAPPVRTKSIYIFLHAFRCVTMTSSIAQDVRNEIDISDKTFDPERQRESALVSELPKSLGAGVSTTRLSSQHKLTNFSSPPWLLGHLERLSQPSP